MVGRMMLRPRSIRSAGCKTRLSAPPCALRETGQIVLRPLSVRRPSPKCSPKCPLRCLVAVLWALAVIVRKRGCGVVCGFGAVYLPRD